MFLCLLFQNSYLLWTLTVLCTNRPILFVTYLSILIMILWARHYFLYLTSDKTNSQINISLKVIKKPRFAWLKALCPFHHTLWLCSLRNRELLNASEGRNITIKVLLFCDHSYAPRRIICQWYVGWETRSLNTYSHEARRILFRKWQ